MSTLDQQRFKRALSGFPSGVTIVTTTDKAGRHWGFTASSFSSVSMDPPLVLVCLANSADSHPAFLQASQFAINILAQDQQDVAMHFAKKHVDKFSGQSFRFGDGGNPAPPLLPGATTSLLCTVHHTQEAGDHTILIGRVQGVEFSDSNPMVYWNRTFWQLESNTVDA